jgi:hypothetical protein
MKRTKIQSTAAENRCLGCHEPIPLGSTVCSECFEEIMNPAGGIPYPEPDPITGLYPNGAAGPDCPF